MKKNTYFFLVFCLLSIHVFGQSKQVTGKITDEEGAVLPGVNVVIKGTTSGTVTDIDGNYTVSVANDDVLVFSFVGMEAKEVKVGNQTSVSVVLKGIRELSEVLVIGYGSAREEDLTGSIAVVSGETLKKVPAASFQEALQGQTPGVQVMSRDGAPGAGFSIRVRGIGSINASNEPLYVVDGIPITASSASVSTTDFDNGGRSANPLAALNTNDIENIVVLKDAASTSIYGARGANGVVLITTKQGKKGAAKIEVSSRVGFSSFAFNNLLEPLTEPQYRQLYVEGKVNAGDFETEEQALAFYNQQYPDQANTNWIDEITQTGVTRQYDASVSGATDYLTYFISGGYFGQDGTVVNNRFDRYTSRLNLSARVSDRLTVNNNLSFSYFDQRGITDGTRWQAPFYVGYLMPPTVPVFDDEGRYYGDHANFLMGGNNPAGHLHDDRREREQSRIIDNFSVTYKLLDNLELKTAWSFDVLNVDDFIYSNGRYGDARNVNGSSQEATADQVNWLGNQTLNYRKELAGRHFLGFLVGFEAQKVATDQLDLDVEGLAHPDLQAPSVGANAQSGGFTSRSVSTFNSMFSRVNYEFDEKYYASFSVRRDGSSRFGPSNRWGTFWSVGGGYVVSKESFVEEMDWLDFLKVRASYGVVGNAELNDNIAATDNNYIWAEAYGSGGIAYDGVAGLVPSLIGNPQLTWETQENLNLGVDLVALQNKLNVTADYFIRNSSDLILNKPLSRTVGFSSQPFNIGDMKNSGWELAVNGEVYASNEVVVNLGGNITFLTNEITRLPEPILDGTKRREAGRDFQEYYLYGWAGVDPDNGDPLWYTDETKTETTSSINNAVRFYDGKSATPDFFGAFNLSTSFKGFTLSSQLNYQFGNYVYDSPGWVVHGDGRFTPRSTSQWAFENRWTTPGQEALFPKHEWGNTSASNTQNSSRYLFKGDYIRLRTVSLSYDLPETWLNSNLRSVRFSILFNNYWTWVKDKNLHFDPEQTVNGVYNSVTPISKTVSIALNVGL